MAETLQKLDSESIVITGVGLITALGTSAALTWENILSGRSGLGEMTEMESPLPAGSLGFQAAELPGDYFPTLPREARYLRYAIESALREAGLSDANASRANAFRNAVLLGTTLHGMRAAGRFIRSQDYSQLTDFLAGDTIRLAIANLPLHGSAATVCSACSSSLASIALGTTMLRTGQADVVIAGGYDTISEYVWAGFNSLRLVTDGPLQPFCRDRRGMKLGEGYGIVLLERQSDAKNRGARIQAYVAGSGESADAHHLTQPHPQGEGANRAMKMALERAGTSVENIGLVSAHATSTPDNDAAEFAAMSTLLGDRLPQVPVICFKTHLGHTLGAAGAAELILSSYALNNGVVPPSANVSAANLEFPALQVNCGQPKQSHITHTLNTSLGFGGANACVVLSSQNSKDSRPAQTTQAREVWITGIGVIVPGALGHQPFLNRLFEPSYSAEQRSFAIADSDFEHILNTRRVRRMSSYVKLMLAAATLACKDGGLIDKPQLLSEAGAILGTTHGPSAFSFDFYSQIIREGVTAANPVMFAEAVPNAGAAQLSLMLGLRGSCLSVIGTRTAGLDAIRLAFMRIAAGEIDRLIVGAGEESQEVVYTAYDRCGLRNQKNFGTAFKSDAGFYANPGAITFVLESADAARQRGATPYGKINSSAAFNDSPEHLPLTLAHLLQSGISSPILFSSANATWIDRVESEAIARYSPSAKVASIYGAFGEMFSATPLLAIAAPLLAGRFPSTGNSPMNVIHGLPQVDGTESVTRFGVLCSNWQGGAAAVEVENMNRQSVNAADNSSPNR